MPNRSPQQTECLLGLLCALMDQEKARILVRPYRDAPGFWFGGGNLVQDPSGTIWLSGRYRNFGDSRTGLEAGERGLECAVMCSDDDGQSFQKVHGWSKAELSVNGDVLSIEGSALHLLSDGTWELFVSSEKAYPYPEPVQQHQKPGTGIWTIERMTGARLEELDPSTLTPVLDGLDRPEYLHVKDPAVFDDPGGHTVMIFCSHPYSWTSSNTGLALRRRGKDAFRVQAWEVVSRGITWDVAVMRITSRLPVPQLGCFAGQPPCSVYFYDGAECIHDHGWGSGAARRPRGYSCEEIGGALFAWDANVAAGPFPKMERLSRLEPLFVSPWGTGCSRYVDSLVLEQGILTTWQQSQEDGSQPLVGRLVPMKDVERILAGK